MSNARVQISESPVRSEVRRHVVHLVEYSRYPRHDPSEDRRVAYTQDRSDTGLGLDLNEVIEPGELLRVTLRDIDGEVDMDGLARVVWCKPGESGRARAGLAMLRENGEKPMIRIRKPNRADSSRAPFSSSN
jgi:hypothetical protein